MKSIYVHGRALFTTKDSQVFGVSIDAATVGSMLAKLTGIAPSELPPTTLAPLIMGGGMRIQADGKVLFENEAKAADQARIDEWRAKNPALAAAADKRREEQKAANRTRDRARAG